MRPPKGLWPTGWECPWGPTPSSGLQHCLPSKPFSLKLLLAACFTTVTGKGNKTRSTVVPTYGWDPFGDQMTLHRSRPDRQKTQILTLQNITEARFQLRGNNESNVLGVPRTWASGGTVLKGAALGRLVHCLPCPWTILLVSLLSLAPMSESRTPKLLSMSLELTAWVL